MRASILPRRPLAVLFLALFAMAVSLSFVFAVLPPIGRDLGLSELEIGLVMAPAALVFVLANGVWGGMVGRIGGKAVIALATAAATLATAAFGWIVSARLAGALSASASFALLVGCRILLGAFAGGFLPAAQAYVAEATAPELRTRALAVIGAGFALGMVTGPGAAAFLARFGAVLPFHTVAALAGAATVIVLAALDAQPRAAHPAADARATTRLVQLLPLLAIVVLVYAAYGIVLQVTGFRIQDELGLTGREAAQHTGIALMIAAAGLVATQVMVARSRLSTRRSMRMLLLGAGDAMLALAIVGFAGGVAGLVGMGLFGVGLGLVLPSALGLLTVVAEAAGDQGRVGGYSGAAQGLGMTFGPLAGAAAYGLDPTAPYLVGLALLASAVALSIVAAPRSLAGAAP